MQLEHKRVDFWFKQIFVISSSPNQTDHSHLIQELKMCLYS